MRRVVSGRGGLSFGNGTVAGEGGVQCGVSGVPGGGSGGGGTREFFLTRSLFDSSEAHTTRTGRPPGSVTRYPHVIVCIGTALHEGPPGHLPPEGTREAFERSPRQPAPWIPP